MAQATSPDTTPGKLQIARNYGALPMSFESNLGQIDPQVRFLSRGAGYSILFKDRETVLLLSKRESAHHEPHRPGEHVPEWPRSVVSTTDLLRMRLVGAAVTPALSGEARLPGTVNCFVGNDPTQWHAGIPTFERVKYTGVYPGVNLVYYGNRQRLEFDFELAPGADARPIRIRFDGARKLKLNPDGNLIIVAANGSVSFHKPVIYQPTGEDRKQPIAGAFHIVSARTVSFQLGRYDRSNPLVIDPILNYSTYLGQSSTAYAIALDSAGEAYVAGWADPGMPTTSGIQPTPVTKSNFGDTSAYVAKFNNTGTALIYCTYLSGSQQDQANGIAVDASGNAFVAGFTYSTDFPTTKGAFQTTNKAAGSIGFITAINSTGTALLYSTYLGGSVQSQITGIAVDASDNAYVTGYTSDTNFPTTPGTWQTGPKSNPLRNPTGFVAKLNPAGAGLAYSTYLGGTGQDEPAAIAVDGTGNAYVAGSTESSNFPITTGAFQQNNKAGTNGTGFVTKLNPSASQLVYSTYLGGERQDSVQAISLDASGDVYVTGFATSQDFPTTSGVFQPTMTVIEGPGSQNAFVTKINSSGTGLVYSSLLGGTKNITGGGAEDIGRAIAVDSSGDAYVAGSTPDIDFPVTAGALQSQNTAQLISDNGASFLTKVNPTATQMLYSTYLSGSGDGSGETCDCANGIAVDSAGNAYLAGEASSTDFPTTQGAFQPESGFQNWVWTTFVTEFNASEMTSLPATTTSVSSNASPQVFGQPVTFTATVQPSGGSTPTGTVGFRLTTVSLGLLPFEMSGWSTVNVNGPA